MDTASTLHVNSAIAARLKALPQSARAKYEHLRRVAQLALATSNGLHEQAQRVRETRDEARADLARFDRRYRPEADFEYKDEPETGGRRRVPAEFPERVALVQTIEAGTAELKRLQDAQGALALGFAFNDIASWLARPPTTLMFTDARVPPRPAKGETLAAALERNREAQARATDELSRVLSAPRTVAEAKALMRQQIEALAAEGRPGISGLFRGEKLQLPTEQFAAGGYGVHEVIVTATAKNAVGLLAWVAREPLIAELDAEIDRIGNDADALSAPDQEASAAKCQATLIHLQREAEALIERLEIDGVPVRRTCANPLVLLGIELVRK